MQAAGETGDCQTLRLSESGSAPTLPDSLNAPTRVSLQQSVVGDLTSKAGHLVFKAELCHVMVLQSGDPVWNARNRQVPSQHAAGCSCYEAERLT